MRGSACGRRFGDPVAGPEARQARRRLDLGRPCLPQSLADGRRSAGPPPLSRGVPSCDVTAARVMACSHALARGGTLARVAGASDQVFLSVLVIRQAACCRSQAPFLGHAAAVLPVAAAARATATTEAAAGGRALLPRWRLSPRLRHRRRSHRCRRRRISPPPSPHPDRRRPDRRRPSRSSPGGVSRRQCSHPWPGRLRRRSARRGRDEPRTASGTAARRRGWPRHRWQSPGPGRRRQAVRQGRMTRCGFSGMGLAAAEQRARDGQQRGRRGP